MKTHRCKELLEYNKNSHIPVAIRYEKWFKNLDINNDYPSWILSNDKKTYSKVFDSNQNYNNAVELLKDEIELVVTKVED